jgi:hypothetical protein
MLTALTAMGLSSRHPLDGCTIQMVRRNKAMNHVRRKRIIQLALDLLGMYADEAEQSYALEPENDIESDRVEIEIGSKLMFAPSDQEYSLMQKKGRGGNLRTKQIITFALNFLQFNIESVCEEYPYYGNVERYAETHVTFDDVSFAKPTFDDVEEILEELDVAVRSFPAMPMKSIGWRVYDYDEEADRHVEIDTVFFDYSCDRRYVRNSLIHDGYNQSILIAPPRSW